MAANETSDPLNGLARTESPLGQESVARQRRTTAFAAADEDGPSSEETSAVTEKRRTSENEANGRPSTSSRRPTRKSTGTSAMARMASLIKPEHKVGKDPSYKQSALAIVKASWLNLLLVFIPVSWALHYANVGGDTVIFIMSFIAIIPLAKLLGFATEEIALRVGQTLGGLINATLGNAVELIVAIIALVKCELQVVQSSLLGSILSNLLLVLGCCFLAGGVRFSEMGFKPAGVQINASLLTIAVIAILIPSAFHAAFGTDLADNVELPAILSMSRGTSVIVLFIYFCYLFFQLWTHAHQYAEDEEGMKGKEGRPVWGDRHVLFKPAKSARLPNGAATANENVPDDEDDEEEEMPSINIISCIVLLIVVTVLVAFTAEFLVDSINGLTETHPDISKEWVGLILLPIVGNAAEHVTAVTVAVKDKLDLSIGVAVGSSIQVALFLIPLLVIISWGLGKPLELLFDPFEAVVLFLSVIIVNYTLQDNRANWLEGILLIMVYLIIAVSFWYYPSVATSTSVFLSTCT